jgi:hypothetical protein
MDKHITVKYKIQNIVTDENRFQHQICVGHHRVHQITRVEQLPVIV